MFNTNQQQMASTDKHFNKNITENYSQILEYFKADNKEEKFLIELANYSYSKKLKNGMKNLIIYKKPNEIVKEIYAKANLTEKLKTLETGVDINKLREQNENNIKTFNSSRNFTKTKENFFRNTKSQNFYKKEEYFFHFNKNLDFLQNFLKELKSEKQISEKISDLINCEISQINSENKQVKFFIILLERLNTLSIKDFISVKEKNSSDEFSIKFNDSQISLIDSLFQDFCIHLSISSNFRSEFLQRIWIAKTNYVDRKFEKKKKELETSKAREAYLENNLKDTQMHLKKNEEKNSKLNEIIENFKNEIKQLNKEIHSRNETINEMSHKLNSTSKQNEMKDNMLKEMFEKVNFRKKRRDTQIAINSEKIFSKEDFNLTNKNKLGNSGANNEIENKSESFSQNVSENKILSNSKNNQQLNDLKNNKKSSFDENSQMNFLRRQSTYNPITKFDAILEKLPSTISNPNYIDLDNKELIKIRKDKLNRKSLKFKYSQKNSTSNMFNYRKQIIVDNSVLNMNTSKFDLNMIDKAKRQLDLQIYLNKGIVKEIGKFHTKGVQTEISSVEYENEIEQKLTEKFKNFESKAQNAKTDLLKLSEIFSVKSHEKIEINQVESDFKKGFEIVSNLRKFIEDSLICDYSNFLKDLDDLLKENRNLRRLIDKFAEDHNETEKGYRDIYDVMLKIISDCNKNLSTLCKDFADVSDGHNKLIPIIVDKIKKIVQENETLIGSEKIKSIIFSENKDIKKIHSYSSLNVNELIKQFNVNSEKISVTLSQKKTLKIIDYIYFNFISEIYFKNNTNDIDSQNPTDFYYNPSFRELPLIYLSNRFIVESLTIRKILEFFKSLTIHKNSHKRIKIFLKILDIYEDNDEEHLIYDSLVIKQIILFLQMIKVENCLITSKLNYTEYSDLNEANFSDSINESKSKNLLIFNKILDILEIIFTKFPIYCRLESKIKIFLNKNKIIHKEKLIFIDFDSFLEFYLDAISELAKDYRKCLSLIFKSIDIEQKNVLNFLDFTITSDCLSGNSLGKNLTELKSKFNLFSNENSLKFQAFESLMIENYKENFFVNSEIFKEYWNADEYFNSVEQCVISLKEDLQGTSINVIDIILKRILIFKEFHKEMEANFIKKAETLRNLIAQYNFDCKDNLWTIWISLKFLDRASQIIYNEIRFSSYFKSLSGVYKILSETLQGGDSLLIEYLNI